MIWEYEIHTYAESHKPIPLNHSDAYVNVNLFREHQLVGILRSPELQILQQVLSRAATSSAEILQS